MMDRHEAIGKFSQTICLNIERNLSERTSEFRLGDGFETTTNSVLSCLLARQASLAIGLAESPMSWSGHIAPLILRAMIDLLITYRWIIIDPRARSTEYVNYGLGAEKLLTSHYQEKIASGDTDERLVEIAESHLAWIESQQFHIFVPVNLGSWAGRSVRKMCEETGHEDLYRFAYTPFSAAVHNMWNHVGKWNAKVCENPMHKRHAVGHIADAWPIVDFVHKSSKYLELTLDAFDDFYAYQPNEIGPLLCFSDAIDELGQAWSQGADSEQQSQ
ncbi:DUF5677 domain-containing protein [Porphyrobacter sp. YT40]|uniref:DUF5677 domain-containing protein n=1 Tax=Porphyrobacter sp. YT40 TaxID=2547601 RepID=UPI001143AEC2|nr:DUF5677 domain-containing protein [Porphyrobacter sp. YT40]QDH34578.1 hypothetical protein E2E27_09720 [Porphyrobacter sp. YT40]